MAEPSDQAKLVLANLIRVLEAAGRTAARSQQAIELAVLQVRRLVMGLPEGLLRERAWAAMKPQVMPLLERMALAVGRDLVLEAAAMVPTQALWAVRYLQASALGLRVSADAPGAAAARRAATGQNNPFAPRTVEAFPGVTYTAADLGRVGSSPELLGQLQQRVPPEVMAQVQQMRIQGGTLQQWFGASVVLQDPTTGRFVPGQGLGGVARDARGLPRFAQFGFRSIDRQVRAGFLSGLSTEEIAQNLIADEIRGQMRLGQSAVRLKSDARAIARTGLAHLAEQVHQQQWQAIEAANPGTIQMWRWDASNDSRTCPSCSALDGRTVSERSSLPGIPLHIQCRCACLPVTGTQLELERRGRAGGQPTGEVLTTEQPPAQRPKEPRAAYVDRLHREGWAVTQQRAPSGERYWRRRVDLPADGGSTVADYLARLVDLRRTDPVGAAVSLQEYWGGGPGGAKRGAVFARLIDSGVAPRDAMQQLFRNVGNSSQRTLVPVRDLAKRWPQWAELLDQVQPQRSVRQQRAIDAGRPMGRPRRGY